MSDKQWAGIRLQALYDNNRENMQNHYKAIEEALGYRFIGHKELCLLLPRYPKMLREQRRRDCKKMLTLAWLGSSAIYLAGHDLNGLPGMYLLFSTQLQNQVSAADHCEVNFEEVRILIASL